jgi:GNAT superfamily N-acetyltransferase
MPFVAKAMAALPYRHIQFFVVSRSLLEPVPEPRPKISLEVQPFEHAHLDFVCREHPPSEANLCAQRLKQGHYGLVACHRGQAVGYGWGCTDASLERINLFLAPGEVLCTDAFTVKAYRNKGVQTALSLARWRLFKKLGFKKVIAYIEINNHPSLAVWQKLGGQVVESIDFRRIGFWRKTANKLSGAQGARRQGDDLCG